MSKAEQFSKAVHVQNNTNNCILLNIGYTFCDYS